MKINKLKEFKIYIYIFLKIDKYYKNFFDKI